MNFNFHCISAPHHPGKGSDPQKRSKLYGKLYEKKEADKERKIKELNEKECNKYTIELQEKVSNNEAINLDLNQKINTLAMISPISSEEKQTLLETIVIDEKVKVLTNIIEFYLHDTGEEKNTLQ